MSAAFVRQLAARHQLGTDVLLEDWEERSAIRQYLAGFTRHTAEAWAIGDVERTYRIGLHCLETQRIMLAGGVRARPPGRAIVMSRTRPGRVVLGTPPMIRPAVGEHTGSPDLRHLLQGGQAPSVASIQDDTK